MLFSTGLFNTKLFDNNLFNIEQDISVPVTSVFGAVKHYSEQINYNQSDIIPKSIKSKASPGVTINKGNSVRMTQNLQQNNLVAILTILNET